MKSGVRGWFTRGRQLRHTFSSETADLANRPFKILFFLQQEEELVWNALQKSIFWRKMQFLNVLQISMKGDSLTKL